jgi:uncharacterized iron-regulated protein
MTWLRGTSGVAVLAMVAMIVAGCSTSRLDHWESRYGRHHPLTGRIWKVSSATFIEPDELVGELARDEFILLGEQHDNLDDHRLQGWIVDRLVDRGLRPVVAFEMLSSDQSDAIQHCLDQPRCDAESFAEEVGWNASGWPDWTTYRPILDAVLDPHLEILAANLPRETVQRLAREGRAGLRGADAALVERLGVDRPPTPQTRAAMADEIAASHCGYAPEEMIDGMILAQRARNANMAMVMHGAAGQQPVVLIAGHGHVRKDRGVPSYLEAWEPGARIAAVAFLEVEDDRTDPASYAELTGAQSLPFDYVWFTPRVDDEDPCVRFEKQLEQIGKQSKHGKQDK